jgi:hypothetical protein
MGELKRFYEGIRSKAVVVDQELVDLAHIYLSNGDKWPTWVRWFSEYTGIRYEGVRLYDQFEQKEVR